MDGAGTNATGTATGAMAGRHFPATIGSFDAPDERARIDGLVRWVEERYADDLRQRPSKHVYVSALPVEVRAHIDALSDSPAVMDAIAARVPAGSSIIPMKHTDELYISH
jgi:hypothetical protein